MSETGDLFDHRHFEAIDDLRNKSRRNDPETSRAAAQQALAGNAVRRRLALTLLAIRPHTDHELAAATGILQTSIGVRRGELVKAGLAEVARDSIGRVQTRPSPSGCACRVWRVTEAGREFLMEATK
jgi:hypothetical protein